jgi:hypothetical protein
MAMQGTLTADFSSFDKAVENSIVTLKLFESSTNKVESNLNKMVDKFTGRQVIAEARLMAEAVERVGGVSRLTAAEIESVGRTAQEARAKFLAWGRDVPPEIQRLSESVINLDRAAGNATPRVNSLGGALGQFDGILGAVGLHIGPEVRALGELGEASGKTASQLGAIATTGLAVGTAFAAFKLTSAILEFTGLDKAIGDATTRLFDFGVAAETTGAKQDTINLAIKRGASDTITYTEAVEFLNNAWVHQHDVANQAAADVKTAAEETKQAEIAAKAAAEAQKKWNDVLAELASAGQTWQQTVDNINGSVAEAVKGYLAAGVSQATLATAYGLTAAQVKALDSARKDELATLTLEQKAAEEWTKTLDAVRVGTTSLQDRILSIDGDIVDWAEHLLDSGVDAQTVARYYGLTDDQVKALQEDLRRAIPAAQDFGTAIVTAAQDAAAAVHTLAGEWISAAEAKKRMEQGGSTKIDTSSQAGRDAVDPKIAVWLHDGYSLQQAAALAFALAWGFPINQNDPLFRTKGPRVPGFKEGGATQEGPAYLHGNEYVVPEAGALVMRGGGNVTVHNTFHIVDTESNIARRVSDTIIRTMKMGKQLPSA